MTGGGTAIPEVHALLATLAVGKRCAEAGTAFGAGAAALAATARSVVTVELDAERAALARERLRDFAHVELVVGDWHAELPPRAPFDLLFLDGGGFKQEPAKEGPLALALLEPAGILVIDDLTPGRREHDPAREFLLRHPRLAAAEILTTPETAAIVAAVLPA
jgi:predicted O-methyltransferase YrrM